MINKILQWFMSEENFGRGALDTVEHWTASTFDRHENVVGALPPATWIEKSPINGFTSYPIRNQMTGDTCVCYTLAKQISVALDNNVGVYREMSPHSVYPFVFVQGGGCNSLTASQYVLNNGITLESLFTTDGLTEPQVESSTGYLADAKAIAPIYKPKNIIQCATDFETIASILQYYKSLGQKKVVAITVIGANNGTWLFNMPQPPIGTLPLWYHRVTVTDFGLINGQKYLSIDNSWGNSIGNNGQQFLSESYAPFIYGGLYLV